MAQRFALDQEVPGFIADSIFSDPVYCPGVNLVALIFIVKGISYFERKLVCLTHYKRKDLDILNISHVGLSQKGSTM